MPETAKIAADSLAEHLLKIIPTGAKIAAYCAVRGEISLNQAIAGLLERGYIVALPVIEAAEKRLKFLEYSPDMQLISGQFGISCPPPHSPEIIPDAVIVPMVGFDVYGNRLGYGGGYYDETIRALRETNKQVQIIGVAYNIQKLDNIPTESHDERMDIIVTEKEIIRCT